MYLIVLPFIESVEKMKTFYQIKELDLFKDGVVYQMGAVAYNVTITLFSVSLLWLLFFCPTWYKFLNIFLCCLYSFWFCKVKVFCSSCCGGSSSSSSSSSSSGRLLVLMVVVIIIVVVLEVLKIMKRINWNKDNNEIMNYW